MSLTNWSRYWKCPMQGLCGKSLLDFWLFLTACPTSPESWSAAGSWCLLNPSHLHCFWQLPLAFIGSFLCLTSWHRVVIRLEATSFIFTDKDCFHFFPERTWWWDFSTPCRSSLNLCSWVFPAQSWLMSRQQVICFAFIDGKLEAKWS